MNDWPAIIRELRRTMRVVDIAVACDRGQTWVIELEAGRIKDPTYSSGVALKQLHAQVTHVSILMQD